MTFSLLKGGRSTNVSTSKAEVTLYLYVGGDEISKCERIKEKNMRYAEWVSLNNLRRIKIPKQIQHGDWTRKAVVDIS